MTMPHKCDGCFWKTDWAEVHFCERLWYESFQKAKDECEKPEPCEYYMAKEEAERIAEKFAEFPN